MSIWRWLATGILCLVLLGATGGPEALAAPAKRSDPAADLHLTVLRPHATDLSRCAVGSVLLALVTVWLCLWRGRDRLTKPGARVVVTAITLAALAILAQLTYTTAGVGWGWAWRLTSWAVIHYWFRFALVTLIAVSWLVIVCLLLYRLSDRRSRLGRSLRFATMTVFTVVFFALGAEVYFRLFYAVSSGFYFTLANQEWNRRYWRPINREGLRDEEWPAGPEDLGGRKLLLVVGDSFPAGAGIRRAEDRFGNRLAAKLGRDYRLMNVARPGWDTRQELEALSTLRKRSLRPDILVWSYTCGDIENVGREAGIERPRPAAPKGRWGSLVRSSYLVNFLYWRLHQWTGSWEGDLGHQDPMQRAYESPEAWPAQAEALEGVIDYARANRARLVVVVWGNLGNLASTAPMTEQVTTFLRRRDITVVDIATEMAGEDPRSLTVNAADAHPNETTHRRVADMIHDALTRPTSTQPD